MCPTCAISGGLPSIAQGRRHHHLDALHTFARDRILQLHRDVERLVTEVFVLNAAAHQQRHQATHYIYIQEMLHH